MNPLFKDVLREIRRTAGRFAAIIIMIALGCGLFTGLKATSPAMLTTASEYIEGCSLMDLRLRSNIGVKSSEIAAVRSAEGVKGACAGYTKELYYFYDDRSIVVKAFSLPENISADSRHFLNRPYIVEGRLPQAKDECAVELKITSPEDFRVGGTVTLSSPDPENDPLEKTLSRDTFKIVGVVISPMFIGYERDAAAVGDGDVNSNIYIPESDFTCDYYTDMFVLLDIPDRSRPFSEEYRNEVSGLGKAAETAFSESVSQRYEKLTADAESKISGAENVISQSEDVLAADPDELAEMLEEARRTVDEVNAKYGNSDNLFGKAAVAKANKQLRMLEELATDESGEVRSAYRAELDEAYEQLSQSREQLAAAPELKIYRDDRFSFSDYGSYSADAEKIANLAAAFPPFFALVAALVCVNAMSRMTAEQRITIGTYKALGYSDGAVFARFSVYGTAAALVGGIAGASVGMTVIPRLIVRAYSMLYNIPVMKSAFIGSYVLWSASVSAVLVNAAVFFSCCRALSARASELMRPEAPAVGKRILAERITFLWGRLGFISKVTLRNLFRYKKRALMTILGVAGSAALMTAGFGLRESVISVLDKQFDEIFIYSAAAALDGSGCSADEMFGNNSNIAAYAPSVMKNVSAGNSRTDTFCSAYMMAFEGSLDGLVDLRSTDGTSLSPGKGVVVTQKLAEMCGLTVGGTVDVRTADGSVTQVEVVGIAENYALNFLYMDKAVYSEMFGDPLDCNVAYLRFADGADSAALKRELISDGHILGVTLIEETRAGFADSTKAMDTVVLLMLFCAMLLAVTVLFGLTDINITERRRELATIKVLGFFDGEVRAYISREMLLLTAAGLPLGMLLGKLLHSYAVKTVEVEALMFPRGLSWQPYILGAVLTVLFSLAVNFALRFKLNKIEMAETLKSVE